MTGSLGDTKYCSNYTLLIRQIFGEIVGQTLEMANSLCFQYVLGGPGYEMLDTSFLTNVKIPVHQEHGSSIGPWGLTNS